MMERRNVLLGIGAVVIVAALIAAPLLGSAPVDRWVTPEFTFDEDRSFADAVELTAYGPRVAGSEPEQRGARYIRDELIEAGYAPEDVVIEQYRHPTYWVENDATIRVDNYPDRRSRTFIHRQEFTVYPWLEGTGGQDITSDLWDVGFGLPEDYVGALVIGKIIYARSGKASIRELSETAAMFGGIALVVQNNHVNPDGGYPAFGGELSSLEGSLGVNETSFEPGMADDVFDQDAPTVPTFIMGNEAGQWFRDEAVKYPPIKGQKPVRVTLRSTIIHEERPISVVVATRHGSEDDAPFTLVGAHMDHYYSGQGAVDNTGGTVTVLEMARSWVDIDTPYSVRFAFWGGEEIGLKGSRSWYAAHQADVDENMLVYLNYDMNNVNLDRNDQMFIRASNQEHVAMLQEAGNSVMDDRYSVLNVTFMHTPDTPDGTDWKAFTPGGHDVVNTKSFDAFSYSYHSVLDTLDQLHPISFSYEGKTYSNFIWSIMRNEM